MIDAGARTSATSGSLSSSVSVSVTLDGATTPWPPDIAPAETVTSLSGECTSFPFAVTVTAPELVVSPAAIVSVVVLDSVKSSAPPPCPPPPSPSPSPLRSTCPTASPSPSRRRPLSEIDDGARTSAISGSLSSSVSVSGAPVTVTVSELAAAWAFAAVPVTVVERPAAPW